MARLHGVREAMAPLVVFVFPTGDTFTTVLDEAADMPALAAVTDGPHTVFGIIAGITAAASGTSPAAGDEQQWSDGPALHPDARRPRPEWSGPRKVPW